MILIADRHIGLSAIGGMVLALLALLAMDSFFAVIGELGDVGKGTYTTSQALWYVLLTVPRRIYELFPVASVVGAMIGVGGLAATSELTAYRAAGMSRQRIAGGVVFATLAVLLLILLIGELLAPRTERLAQSLRTRAQSANVALSGDASIWVRDGERLINAHRPLASDEDEPIQLADIDIFEFEEGVLARLVHADLAVHTEGSWEMRGVKRSMLAEDQIRVIAVDSERAESLVDPAVLGNAITRPRNLALTELIPFVRYLEANGLDAGPYRAALWWRAAYPATAVVIVVACMVFVFGSNRSGGFGQRLFIGMLFGIGFTLVNRIAVNIGEVYRVNMPFMAFAPSVVLAIISWRYLRKGF